MLPWKDILPLKRPGLKPGKKFYVFLVCLGIATVFWLLNAFSKTYTQLVRFPVKYQNLPEDQVLLNKLPEHLGVVVSGYGFDLLNVETDHRDDSLLVDGSSLTIRQSAEGYEAKLYTRSLLRQVTRSLSSNLKIENFDRDSLFFIWQPRASQLVPLDLDLELDLAPQYLLDGKVELIPTAVQLSGPASIIDTVTRIKTKLLKLENLQETKDYYLELLVPGAEKGVVAQPSKALLKVPVDQFTEDTLALPLSVINMPDSLSIKTFPSEVVMTYRVGLRKYDKVRPALFQVVVDYEDVELTGSSKLRVRTLRAPDFVEVVRFAPSKVEYILRK